MERIDLFDRYILGQLSKEEKESFEQRISTDANLASQYNAYLLCVNGIRNEANQDNIEFYHAMKGVSRKELLEIIGKEPMSISRQYIIEQIRGVAASATSADVEGEVLSGLAACSNGPTPDDEIEITESKTDSGIKKNGKGNAQSDNLRLITFIFIVILLIALIVSIFI
jgi:hypothetical protein